MTAVSEPLLRVEHLSKTFPGVKALDDVSLQVDSGEIVAVVGHNGSGKSTLVKILAGIHSPDPGAQIDVPNELHVVHQDLGLVDMLTTVENLGLEPTGLGRDLRPIRSRAQERRAYELIARFGPPFPVSIPVGALPQAERAIVAIARALDGWTRSDNILVLDEPTTAFGDDEVQRLFDAVRRIAAEGAGVVFISHRLDEVLGLADRVVVLRDGCVVADEPCDGLDHDRMVELIAGAAVAAVEVQSSARNESPVLAVSGLSGGAVRDVTFGLRPGEILGVSGLLGSGREGVCGLVFGAQRRAAGTVALGGRTVPAGDMAASIDAGLGYVPPDRRRGGAVMDMSVRENLTLPMMAPLRRRFGWLDTRAEQEETHRWARAVALRRADPEGPVRLLSGGNQQKVVIAKWLRTEPRVLLLDEPTQGVDVGAKAAIYELIAAAARNGTGVVVSSSDPEELVTLCDRVLVMQAGRVAADVPRDELTEARLVREELALSGGPSPAGEEIPHD
jgi:ABC-type sugar transport system ATPase subunit